MEAGSGELLPVWQRGATLVLRAVATGSAVGVLVSLVLAIS